MLLKQNLTTEMNSVIGLWPQQRKKGTTTYVEEMDEDVEVAPEDKEEEVVAVLKVMVLLRGHGDFKGNYFFLKEQSNAREKNS